LSPAIKASRPLLLAAYLATAGCAGIGSKIDRLPPDAAARGYVVLPRPVTLPRSRLTADCGPETICAVMNYWGKPASVQELSFLVRDPKAQGILTTSVGPLARRKGLRSTPVHGSVGRIKNAIDREIPPIIMVDSGGGYFHFFVVTGYNDKERHIVCEEYQDAKRLISYEELEELWAKPDHFMLEVERSRAHDDYLVAAEREADGRYAEAAALYRRALEGDAEHVEARVGLGNCLYFQGKLPEARAEYQRALELNPADPKVCNNLASVLAELREDAPKAVSLAERAVGHYDAAFRRLRHDAEREPRAAVRQLRQKELAALELDLADALGTLGQARAADGRHELAVAAWKASLDHYPLTEFDARARRHYEIGLSLRQMSMPAEARKHLEQALGQARDPALRARIEASLK
jgi:tetratricopeptide (TPR) repeat protein